MLNENEIEIKVESDKYTIFKDEENNIYASNGTMNMPVLVNSEIKTVYEKPLLKDFNSSTKSGAFWRYTFTDNYNTTAWLEVANLVNNFVGVFFFGNVVTLVNFAISYGISIGDKVLVTFYVTRHNYEMSNCVVYKKKLTIITKIKLRMILSKQFLQNIGLTILVLQPVKHILILEPNFKFSSEIYNERKEL